MIELLEKAKNGDEAAYEQVVSMLYKDLYNVALAKLRNVDDANDVVQETLIKFHKNFKTINDLSAAKSWAIKVLINECKNLYRANKRYKNLEEKLKYNVEFKESDIDKIEYKIITDEILDKLNEKEKLIFILHYENEYSIPYVSELLNMKESTVKSIIHRGKKKTNKDESKNNIYKFSVILLLVVLVGTGITFAGRVIKTLKEIITIFQIEEINAINFAMENNYIQEIDSEFVYDKDIGIKIDKVTMDDKFLYLSYKFNFENNDNINDIELENYSIYDENKNVLSVGISNDINNIYGSDYSSGGATFTTKPIKNEDGSWSYSAVYQVVYNKNYPLSKLFDISIDKIILTTDTRKEITGNWNFKIDLDDKFSNRNSEYYEYETNDKVNNISAKLNDLSLEITIEFNENINKTILKKNNIIINNEKGEKIEIFSEIINVYNKTITYICDVGKYSENIDKMNLYVKYDYGSDKFIDVILERK